MTIQELEQYINYHLDCCISEEQRIDFINRLQHILTIKGMLKYYSDKELQELIDLFEQRLGIVPTKVRQGV